METQSDAKTPSPTGACQGGLLQPQREKHWDELTDPEKIGRLRLIVKELERQLARTTKRTARALDIAEWHEHGATGNVVVPANRGLSEPDCDGAGRRRDEKWF